MDVKLSGVLRGSNIQNAVKSKYVDSLIRDIESNAISSAVYGTPLNMSNLAAGYIQNLAQNEGEQLKDALDKARQLDQAHYREAQTAARGDKYFGDSPSHKHVLASVSERVRTAAMERTLPKGEVNEEALLRDFLEPSDMERAIAAELAKVDQEILGGRNESRWTDYAKAFGKGFGTEISYPFVHPIEFGKGVLRGMGSLAKLNVDVETLNVRGLYETGSAMVRGEIAQGRQFWENSGLEKAGMLGTAAADVTALFAPAGIAKAATGVARLGELASKVGMFGRAAEIGEVGAEVATLFKTGGLSAEEANVPFVKAGKRPPYAPETRARIIQLQRDRVLMRVHGEQNQVGEWLLRPKEIEKLTPKQIQDKLALSYDSNSNFSPKF